MPRLPLTNSESVVRVTPSAAAAAVIVNPSGSMHSRSTTSPGCDGFFIGITGFLLMVVDQIDITTVAGLEAKDHPPIGPNRHCPESSQVALQRMQSKARQIHIGDDFGCVESRENVA